MEKFFYRVQKGDSVASVGARFEVPPSAIIKTNGLTSDIREGDVIFVEKPSGRVYSVRPFDTIESIAAKFGVSAEEIKRANGVDYAFYGLDLIVPD